MTRKEIASLIKKHGPETTLNAVLMALGFECPACTGNGYTLHVYDDPRSGSAEIFSSKSGCKVCGGTGSTEVEMVQKVVVTEVKDGWVAK